MSTKFFDVGKRKIVTLTQKKEKEKTISVEIHIIFYWKSIIKSSQSLKTMRNQSSQK